MSCGVAQMSAIQGSIGSLREGVHTWGHSLKLAQEVDEQDAQQVQQARASHSQAASRVCRLQVSVFKSGVTVWQYAHALFKHKTSILHVISALEISTQKRLGTV